MEANIILTALNIILFVLQIAAFSHMCSKINTLHYNDGKAIKAEYQHKEAIRESMAAKERYEEKLKTLKKAEDIAAMLATEKHEGEK